MAARFCGQPNRKIRPAQQSVWAGVPLKVTSKVELKKTSRMAAQAEGTIPPTEKGLIRLQLVPYNPISYRYCMVLLAYKSPLHELISVATNLGDLSVQICRFST